MGSCSVEAAVHNHRRRGCPLLARLSVLPFVLLSVGLASASHPSSLKFTADRKLVTIAWDGSTL